MQDEPEGLETSPSFRLILHWKRLHLDEPGAWLIMCVAYYPREWILRLADVDLGP
jgi:hypothetical protein